MEKISNLKGLKVLITAGSTIEAIDPVRYISNFSSGKQGYAIAEVFANLGALVTLISGPSNIQAPHNVTIIKVTSALEMLAACKLAMPTDIAICAAAISDWRPEKVAQHKIKKDPAVNSMNLTLVKNPDILHNICQANPRPKIVIGFAAETENVIKNAKIKQSAKGCDIIIANNVSKDAKVFNSDDNQVHIITKDKIIDLPRMSKIAIAQEIAQIILQ